MNPAQQVAAFLKLGRPRFLIGGLLLFALGSALAALRGVRLDWARYAWGQAVITSAQWMTNYSNDYFDLDADRANATPTRWSGGSRVLVSGALRPCVALLAALCLGGMACIAALELAAEPRGSSVLLALSLLIIVLAWCYSAPPLRLLSRGLGEGTTALVVTFLTPLLGFVAQNGALDSVLILACFPLVCVQFSMSLTIELPDAAGDAAQGKRTLVVRYGAPWAARLSALLLVTAFGSLPLLFVLGLPLGVAAVATLPAPLAVWQALRLWRGAFRDPKCWERLTQRSVLLVAITALAELGGALLTLWIRH